MADLSPHAIDQTSAPQLCKVAGCPFDALPNALYCYAHTIDPKQTKQNSMSDSMNVVNPEYEKLPPEPLLLGKPFTLKHDPVNHPSHYCSHPSGIECITVTEHMNFNVGNAIKYLWRESHKNGIEDLKKAAWYINREIKRLETLNAKANS